MFQETFMNFNINFNALNAKGSFSSGDFMAGQIIFELAKTTKIESIKVFIKGKARILWTTGGGKKKSRRTHSAKLSFFNISMDVLQAYAVGPTVLQPGTHTYPFSCQLPAGDFPSSFRGAHGSIFYCLKVEIRRPWRLMKAFVTEFKFASHEPNDPQLLAPLAGSNSKMLCCLWCASGPITMTTRLERKGFCPGETIKIMCEFSNPTSRDATPKAVLVQHQRYFSSGGAKKMVETRLASEIGPPVNGGSPETTLQGDDAEHPS